MAEVFNVCYDEGLDHLSEINLLQQLCLSPQSKRELAVDFDGIPTFQLFTFHRGGVSVSLPERISPLTLSAVKETVKKRKRGKDKKVLLLEYYTHC